MLSKIHTFTTTLLSTQLEAEFNNIAYKFGFISGDDLTGDLLQSPGYYIGLTSTSTDLATLVSAAVAAGKQLFLAPGTYYFADYELPDNITIIGSGVGETILDIADTQSGSYGMIIGGTGVNGKYIKFKNLTITGTGTYPAGTYLINIDHDGNADDCHDIVFENVQFKFANTNVSSVIRFSPSGASDYFKRIEFIECSFLGYGIGDHVMYADQGVLQLVFDSCVFTNVSRAIYVLNPSDHAWVHMHDCEYSYDLGEIFYIVDIECPGRIENNMFRLGDNVTVTPSFVECLNENNGMLVVKGNQFAANDAGWPRAAVTIFTGRTLVRDNHTDMDENNYDFIDGLVKLRFNTTTELVHWENNDGTPDNYTGNEPRLRSPLFGKTFDDMEIFRLGDVMMWVGYTGTTNTLRFKKGVPTSVADFDASLTLNGTTSLL